MKAYIVGGAVRDHLMGLPQSDKDWVVLGVTPQYMLEKGFRPVGNDFPVFLHPDTHEEYALARTERKVSPGYRGFLIHSHPSVTLEEDLLRRDLTINAMAWDLQGGIIDPYGGQEDLKRKILRHVSPAFIEDPVRVLRLGRFYARFSDFSIAAETRELIIQMVQSGEINSLVSERIWGELASSLMTAHPERMLDFLSETGVLEKIAPLLGEVWNEKSSFYSGMRSTRDSLLIAASSGSGLLERTSLLLTELSREKRNILISSLSIPRKYIASVEKAADFVQSSNRDIPEILDRLFQNWKINHSVDYYNSGLLYLSLKCLPFYFKQLEPLLHKIYTLLKGLNISSWLQESQHLSSRGNFLSQKRIELIQKTMNINRSDFIQN